MSRPPKNPYEDHESSPREGGQSEVMPHKNSRPRTVKVRLRTRDLPQSYLQRTVAAREKQVTALKLRASGATYKDIARTVGYANESSARKAVIAALERWGKEEAQEVFAQDLVRLDEYTLRLTERLRNHDDVSQIDRLLRVMQQRWQLLGLIQSDSYGGKHDPKNPLKPGDQNFQNNGVMVITGSERQFVESMMQAVGVSTETKEAKSLLRELEAGDTHRKEILAGTNPNSSRKNTRSKSKSLMSDYTQVPTSSSDDEDVLDAEIVEEEL